MLCIWPERGRRAERKNGKNKDEYRSEASGGSEDTYAFIYSRQSTGTSRCNNSWLVNGRNTVAGKTIEGKSERIGAYAVGRRGGTQRRESAAFGPPMPRACTQWASAAAKADRAHRSRTGNLTRAVKGREFGPSIPRERQKQDAHSRMADRGRSRPREPKEGEEERFGRHASFASVRRCTARSPTVRRQGPCMQSGPAGGRGRGSLKQKRNNQTNDDLRNPRES